MTRLAELVGRLTGELRERGVSVGVAVNVGQEESAIPALTPEQIEQIRETAARRWIQRHAAEAAEMAARELAARPLEASPE
jgi:hypothetical protein